MKSLKMRSSRLLPKVTFFLFRHNYSIVIIFSAVEEIRQWAKLSQAKSAQSKKYRWLLLPKWIQIRFALQIPAA